MSDPLAPGVPETGQEAEVFLSTSQAPAPGQAGPPAATPPFNREDLATAPPEYWIELQRGFETGDISTDDYYQLHRQRVHDDENPMLGAIRATQAAASPATAPLASGQPGQPLDAQPPPTLATGAVPEGTPVQPPPPSTAEQISGLLSTIGLQGIRPVQPASSLLEALYGQDPAKESNPVYRTAWRLAAGLDAALTVLNIPITGLGDLADVVLAPLTLGLQAAGFDQATIKGFVENARLLPEMAAAFGTGAGALGTLGKVGNLTGLGAELGPLMARAGRVMKLEESFSATMRDVWKSERGEVRVPGGEPITPEILMPDTPQTLAAKYEAAVIEARRGGPRTLEQVAAEGQALIDQGLVSMDTIKQIKPGTALNDAEAWATVRVLADEGLRLKTIAARALETQHPQDVQSVLEQFYTFSLAHDPKRIGVEAEAGRSLNVMNDPIAGLKRFLLQFEEVARNSTTGFDGMTVVRAIAAFDNPGQLSVLARQAAKPGFWDMFKEYYVNGLLWGPKTWAANFLGNSVTALWSIPERQLAALIGGGQGVQAGEAWELMHGILGSQLDAWRLAAKAFQEGESQFGKSRGLTALDKIELPRKAISADTFELTGLPGTAVDLLGNTVRFPSRVLAGTDDFFKVIQWRGEQRAVALREARQEAMGHGLTGREFAEYVDTRIADKMADPPLSIQRAADAHALYQTFTNELGSFGKKIQALSNTVAGKIILPFVRTFANMAKWVGERTPLMLANKRFWEEINGEDRAVADMAKAKVALGSFTLSIAALWFYNGQLTSGGPSDPKIRKDMEDHLGWKPYAVKIGNRYVSINRLEPPGMLLGLGADFADAILNSDADSVADWEEAANAAVVAVAKGFTNRTMVKGVAETMAALSDPDRMAESRLSSFLASLIPLSGLVRQSEQVLDPTMREAHGVMQRVRSQIPGVSATLPPRLTLDGDPVYMTGVWGPISVSEMKDDPVAKERIKVGAHIPDIPKTVSQIELTGAERHYWAYQRGKMKVGGMTVKERQAETIASDFYKESSKEIKAFLLERDITLHQQEAWLKTLEHYPNLETSIDKAREQRFGGPKPADNAMTPLIRSLTR